MKYADLQDGVPYLVRDKLHEITLKPKLAITFPNSMLEKNI